MAHKSDMLLILFLSSDWPCDRQPDDGCAVPVSHLPSQWPSSPAPSLHSHESPAKCLDLQIYFGWSCSRVGVRWCKNGTCVRNGVKRTSVVSAAAPHVTKELGLTCQRLTCAASPQHVWKGWKEEEGAYVLGVGGWGGGRQGRALFQLPLRAASCDPRRLTFSIVRRSSASFVFCH